MKQFLLPCPPEPDGRGRVVRLSGKDYHYLVRVRRLAPGSEFNAVQPGGAACRFRVRSVDGGVLVAECLDAPGECPNAPAKRPKAGQAGGAAAGNTAAETGDGALPPLVLFQALPRGVKMDLIVRQAVEGGIAEIVSFVSARSVPVRLQADGDRCVKSGVRGGSAAAGRLERWRRIVREARQQSGSAVATVVEPPRNFEETLTRWRELRERHEKPVGLLLHPEADPGALRPGFPPLEKGSFHRYLEGKPGLVAIAVGPEGGFSPEEAVRFVEEGFKPVSMGNTVLRAETAAVYAAAAIRIILLEIESWTHKVQER
ncbi:MAG: 16S rRNA (uracil(1498)-N(3))-methyltransferase [Treponema sp.]|jgi:16S rRNA (uracil1498-N3)-methyltransferase|nr:16S rRNA (uracil(1498)-N(3))-methyltransferase [Treponema sp.]